MTWAIATVLVGVCAAQPANPPVIIPYDVPPLRDGSIDFGNLEADSLLDLAATGQSERERLFVLYRVYVGEGGINRLFEIPTSITPIIHGAVRWGDYDADGDDDLVVVGLGEFVENAQRIDRPVLELYENRGPSAPGLRFTRAANLPGLVRSSADWGDFDADGDLDLVVSGLPSLDAAAPVTRIYRNDQGTFVHMPANLPGVHTGDVGWSDVDGDGDLDLALMGDTGGGFTARLFRNEGGAFIDTGTPLPSLAYGSLDWGDYDGDGDEDLLVSGGRLDPRFLLGITRVYRNDDGVLADSGADLGGWTLGDALWGDADRDGDLDVFVVGAPAALGVTHLRLFVFDGAGFLPVWDYAGARFASLTVADYNSDGDADVALIGEASGKPHFRFITNWDYRECLDAAWVPRGAPRGICGPPTP